MYNLIITILKSDDMKTDEMKTLKKIDYPTTYQHFSVQGKNTSPPYR